MKWSKYVDLREGKNTFEITLSNTAGKTVSETKGYDYLIGDYSKGKLNGQGQLYHEGSLIYDGSFKNNEPSGKGTAYYPDSNNICYDGDFTFGKYNGTGTKYYEDGSVEYSGKWRSGEPA